VRLNSIICLLAILLCFKFIVYDLAHFSSWVLISLLLICKHSLHMNAIKFFLSCSSFLLKTDYSSHYYHLLIDNHPSSCWVRNPETNFCISGNKRETCNLSLPSLHLGKKEIPELSSYVNISMTTLTDAFSNNVSFIFEFILMCSI
jgi:hypothetical protein